MKLNELAIHVPPGWEALPAKKLAEVYRERYEQLFDELDRLGTLVSIQSMVEATNREPDGKPAVWEWRTNSGMVDFIFPKQTDATASRDDSYVLATGQDKKYRANRIVRQFPYDSAQVSGHLRLQYDSSTTPLLHVSDLLEHSELPDEVCLAIQTAFYE